MRTLPLVLMALSLTVGASFAADDPSYPEWWYEMGLVNSAAPVGNQSPVNQGQLKNAAVRTRAYLKFKLGMTDAEWDAAWAAAYTGPYAPAPSEATLFSNTGNNWLIVSQGQGKNAALGFYNILQAEGHNTQTLLAQHAGGGGWAYSYPWNPSLATAHKSPLLIGQLKFMFSLDLGPIGPWMDTDGDGIDDRIEWRMFNGLGHAVNAGALYADIDMDLFSQMIEILAGANDWNHDQSIHGSTWDDVEGRYRSALSEGGVVIVLPDTGVYAVNQPELFLRQL